jgi:hypothetical protein
MKKLQNFLLLSAILFSTIVKAQDNTAEADCYDAFFKSSTPIKNKTALKLVLKNGKESSVSAFMKANYMEMDPQAGLKDIDGDGTKELIIWNYTGGAHCCDEFYFFKNTGVNKYTFAAKLFAGNTCVDAQNNFSYNLHESFGYFFTCFACGLVSDEEGAKPSEIKYVADLSVKYTGGKLQIQPGTEGLKATIKKNLSLIKKLGWDGGIKEADFDDGRRKELALNLAAFYFSFGKNLVETKALFTANYPFKDAPKVWTQFVENLNNVKKSNDF